MPSRASSRPCKATIEARFSVFRSIVDLQAAIKRYINEHNDHPMPFTWTKPADTILDKLNLLNASLH
jgi:hypothetical protein